MDALAQALKTVERAAPEDWKARALIAVELVAARHEFLTSDDIWLHLHDAPPEPRALGPVMLQAVRLGFIEATDMYRKSRREPRHKGIVRVWRSLIVRRFD